MMAGKRDRIPPQWLLEETWSILDGLKKGQNQPLMAVKDRIVYPGGPDKGAESTPDGLRRG